MSLYIEELTLPYEDQEPIKIELYADGTAVWAMPPDNEIEYKAVPVPPHGRLIDANALEKDIDKYIGGEESRSRFHHWVQVQRAVIPESEEEHT